MEGEIEEEEDGHVDHEHVTDVNEEVEFLGRDEMDFLLRR